MTDSDRLIRWIAKQKFYGCYETDKYKAIEYSRSWLNDECVNSGWTKEIAIKASKHVGCRNLTEFRKLCIHYSNPK